ncbi:hypothetical protein A3K34_01060 [candidate division WWE3 bacterium RIFOXYC1_FULL_40_10]|uniref:inorganic diphosphatase n=1 Tax=candidate division WWE3 bacterium RIFOXYA2_FULL_46_9 TaxID=1802636 RepID=A0A1F4W1V3_UNCKA|nr:MAG: hypothetical protein A3K58_01060 [candidate division WWE3 bacterium RIFOXYB1_FULL_40_22]OGC61458.1 MAG: hypothetical protein A3K37_01060 [candidate division WWE3 bacterium RIFOXYA1_FULL_40_11]OGC63392.1 MAG: hypothetical protein A2264_01535 [candidate division WWE3 bacterium RIFOXYA2_FULL_46_9]OGC64578.1 MAG: hypothetical protein A2326_03700 [candidate division WWE3 bacterium RIFOXYB2_FULL_41_6]OGC65841.1 MAG: hypothetical protein A3K34_01060 [candidate division WWE3 bacterium RIFOXYC1_
MNIYLIGHIAPDLDSVAAPVAYAEFLDKSKRYEDSKVIPVLSGDVNKETEFVFKEAKIDLPLNINDISIDPTDAFILVDHNEISQRHPKIPHEQVIEIIDHHKINIDFVSPIRLDVKPYGSTSTIVYEHFDTYGQKPSEGIAKLMLAAILSDTQGLKSSTTTGIDSEYAHQLAKTTETDIERFTFELFKSKSDITGMTPQDIARKDYKIFDFDGKKVFINQIETVEPDKILDMQEEIARALEEIKSIEGAGQAYCVVTDVLKVNSHIIFSTDEEKSVAEKAFTTQAQGKSADIGPRTSRKKDIAPEIERVILYTK